MSALVSNAWIVVVGPILIALLGALVVRGQGLVAPALAATGPLATVAVALAALVSLPAGGHAEAGTRLAEGSVTWFATSTASLQLAWAVDALTGWMLLVVGVVATCVVVFSIGYLSGDSGWGRYFALISLFTGAMNLLVIADSFTALFVGWELVGACSYLLIGFWYQKPAAAAAATKAFLTTRVGDVGLLVAIAVLWVATGTDSYSGVMSQLGALPAATINLAAVGLAIGAMGKSAQFPLHAWLPDAMEGPTPISALIHAATMVAAGVFLVVRVWPLFEASAQATSLLLAVGLVSALGAALVATVQRDIKKVLAYSTVSQLGFMFAALGVGAPEAAFFHLMTHAAFKGLLFLVSGSVIHGAGTQDLHEMGGLRRAMPITFAAWSIGVLALAGVVPLSGFFSKDAILEAVWHASPLAGGVLFAASLLTAFYAARATRLAFFGSAVPGAHAHESPPIMLVPLVALVLPAAVAGSGMGIVSSSLGAQHAPLAIGVSAAALLLAAIGGIAGWMSSAGPARDGVTRARWGGAGDTIASAYYWDALVDRAIVRPTVGLSRGLWAWGDRLIADGWVEGLARAVTSISSGVRRLQSGDAQAYASVIAASVAIILAATIWLGR
ncbi:MAG: NADH-quinone oxidoreductase subunit L [Coriobacteriia bacterium]|nr:NADH-quinone oxidoreductase subunit L [Coriobacteriia bacterium]